jgi:hypothetical protein
MAAAAWALGLRQYSLRTAVDEGAANVETRGIGEVGDEVIHKAIGIQRSTLPFWTTLALLGDFLAEPLALVLRAMVVATLFAVVAALTCRTVGFADGLTSCARAQGFWVLGMATRLGLMIALRRPEAETSLALVLASGSSPAALLLASRQIDAFVILGWVAVARGGWRRGQVNLAAAVAICGSFWILESIVRIAYGLIIGAGMRLTVMP